MERARNVYRSVKELTQLRTGRLRTLVEGTSWMLAGRVAHRATTDYKIDAEKIHLG